MENYARLKTMNFGRLVNFWQEMIDKRMNANEQESETFWPKYQNAKIANCLCCFLPINYSTRQFNRKIFRPSVCPDEIELQTKKKWDIFVKKLYVTLVFHFIRNRFISIKFQIFSTDEEVVRKFLLHDCPPFQRKRPETSRILDLFWNRYLSRRFL